MIRAGILVMTILAVWSSPSWAVNHYVRAAASGTGSGADWTNAYTDLPASLTRGDTYYVAAGTYGIHAFSDTASGTTVITIKSPTVTDHGTATGWSDSFVGQAIFIGPASPVATGFAVLYFTTGYYTIDGVYGCGPTATCGILVDHSNISAGAGGCGSFPGDAIHVEVQGGNVDGIRMQYLEIKGTKNVSVEPNNLHEGGVQVGKGQDDYFGHNWVHDQGAGWALFDNTTNLVVEHNYFRNNFSTSQCHAEGLAIRGPTVNLTIRYNVFENSDGTAYIANPNGQNSSNWYIYGNVFVFNAGNSNGQHSAGGMFQIFGTPAFTGDFFVYNNTISALDRGPSSTGSCNFLMTGSATIAILTVRNNLWYNCFGSITPPTAGITTRVWTHNAYFDTMTSDTDADKQTASGNPFVDVSQVAGHSNLHLVNATSAGVTLASPYNADPDGVTRGVDGTWDRGAYESGSGAPPLPAAPPGGRPPARRRR